MSAGEDSSSAAGAAPLVAGQLTVAEIRKRLDALAVAMSAKGLRAPTAELNIKSQATSRAYIHLGWPATKGSDHYKFFHGEIDKAFADAAAFVAALPSPEKARMQAFLIALGEAIAAGKAANVDGEFVNPLTVMMKKLSKNALVHQAAS